MESPKELPERIARFRSLHEESPSERFFVPLADLLAQAGFHEEALVLLDEGLGLQPGYLAALVIQGRTLYEVGRTDEAQVVWIEVLGLDRDNVLALEFLADRAMENQEWERAAPLLDRLCRLMGEDSRWAEYRLEARGQLTRATAAALQVQPPEVGKGSSFDTMTLVDIYLAQGYRDRALAVLRRMLPESGSSRNSILERIRLLENVGEVEAGAVDSSSSGGSIPGPRMPRSIKGKGPKAGGDRFPASEEERTKREEDRSRRRAAERQQFEEWLEKIRFNGGHGG